LHDTGIKAGHFRLTPPWLAFGKQIMATTGDSDQCGEDDGADEKLTNSNRHEKENAWNSVKDSSMLCARRTGSSR
jgi:hypothetical protein